MNRHDAIVEAIRNFKFWDYGMDEVDPNSEYAEWVPDLAEAINVAIQQNETQGRGG